MNALRWLLCGLWVGYVSVCQATFPDPFTGAVVTYVCTTETGAACTPGTTNTDSSVFGQAECDRESGTPGSTVYDPLNLIGYAGSPNTMKLYFGCSGFGAHYMGVTTNCSSPYQVAEGVYAIGASFNCVAIVPGTCSGNAGHFFDWSGITIAAAPGTIDDFQVKVDAEALVGAHVCVNGCRARTTSAKCTHSDGPCPDASVSGCSTGGGGVVSGTVTLETCGGVAMYDLTASACAGTDKAVLGLNLKSTDATNTGISAGGKGSVPAAGTSNQVDSINLARIASNTSDIADKVGAGGSGSGSGGSTCGVPDQPKCAIDEGNTADSGTAAGSFGDAQTSTLGGAMDTKVAGLSFGAAPDMGSSSRWTLSFAPFLSFAGDAVCKVSWNLTVGGAAVPMGADWCSWVSYVKDFLAWVMYAVTVVTLWAMLYSGKEGA